MQFENEIKKLCEFTYKLYHSTRVDYKIIVIIITMVDNFCEYLCFYRKKVSRFGVVAKWSEAVVWRGRHQNQYIHNNWNEMESKSNQPGNKPAGEKSDLKNKNTLDLFLLFKFMFIWLKLKRKIFLSRASDCYSLSSRKFKSTIPAEKYPFTIYIKIILFSIKLGTHTLQWSFCL